MAKKHTKEMIMEALQELYDEYDCIIRNLDYRGPSEKVPEFTFKELDKKVPRTIPTIRKWCHTLEEEGKITMRYKKSYFANDPLTYVVTRTDFKPKRLRRERVYNGR